MKRVLLPLGVAALVLSGCSGSDASEPVVSPSSAAPSPSATEEAVTLGPGSFTFETPSGATGTLEVPGAPNPDIESMRVEVGAPEVTYLTGNLDNRAGSEAFDVYTISVYDMEGNKYDYMPAQDYIGDITPDSEVVGTDVYNRYIEAYNNASTVIDALERKDFVMVGPEMPDEIAGVSVSNGFEDFGAQLAG